MNGRGGHARAAGRRFPRLARLTRPATCMPMRAPAHIFPARRRRVLLRIRGEPLRNQIPDAAQARLHLRAALAECGGRFEGVGYCGSAGPARRFGQRDINAMTRS
jgi:hypothetical protein